MRSFMLLAACITALPALAIDDPALIKNTAPQAVKIHAFKQRYRGPDVNSFPSTSPSNRSTIVYRSRAHLGSARGTDADRNYDAVIRELGVPAIDFDKQMLLLIRAGVHPSSSQVRVWSTEFKGSRLIVRWDIVPGLFPNATEGTALVMGMFLVDKFDGEVAFDPPIPWPQSSHELRRKKQDDEAEASKIDPSTPVMVEEFPPAGSDLKIIAHSGEDEYFIDNRLRTGAAVAVRSRDDIALLPYPPKERNLERLLRVFRLGAIDFNKHMVLFVTGGAKSESRNFFQVESIRKQDGKIVVRTRVGHLDDPSPEQYAHGRIMLVERAEGEVVLERNEAPWLKGKLVPAANADKSGDRELKVYVSKRSGGLGRDGERPGVTYVRHRQELWKLFGETDTEKSMYHAERAFNQQKIDLKTQMILRVHCGHFPDADRDFRVTALTVKDGVLRVHTELTRKRTSFDELKESNPSELLLVERFDGPIRMAPIDDKTTLKHALSDLKRIAILGQATLDLPADAKIGPRDSFAAADRKMSWTVNTVESASKFLNMTPEKSMELIKKTLKVDNIDFEKHTLLMLANGPADGARTYTFKGGKRISANVFAALDDKAFLIDQGTLRVFYEIEEKPDPAAKPRLPIEIVLIERFEKQAWFELADRKR